MNDSGKVAPSGADGAAARATRRRLLAWMGYGQYGFMASLALAGLIGMCVRASRAGAPGRATALGFAVLFAAILGYSLWCLRRHFSRQRSQVG
jgi:hypothetical protein